MRVYGIINAMAMAMAMTASTVESASPTSCKFLTDRDSTFMETLGVAMNATGPQLTYAPIEAIFGPLDVDYPWFSRCAASFNVIDMGVKMMMQPSAAKCLKALEDATTTYEMLSDDYFRQFMCPLLKETVVPCISDVVLDAVQSAMDSSGGCCDDMNTMWTSMFNTSMVEMVDTFLKLGGNVICSVKSYPDTTAKSKVTTQSCGQSLLSTYLKDTPATLQGFLQLPNAQACMAMNNLEFKTTQGNQTAQFSTPLGESKIGVCYKPIEMLTQYVSEWPIVKKPVEVTGGNSLVLSDIMTTTPDVCVNGSHVMDFVMDNGSTIMQLLSVADSAMEFLSTLSLKTPDTPAPEEDPEPTITPSLTNAPTATPWADMYWASVWTNSTWYRTGNVTAFVQETMLPYVDDMRQYCMHIPRGVTCDFPNTALIVPFNASVPMPTPAPSPIPSTVPKRTVSSATAASLSMVCAAIPMVLAGL